MPAAAVATEQGDLLFAAARDMKSASRIPAHACPRPSERRLGDTEGSPPRSELGSLWHAQRIPEFLDLYPDISVEMLLSNEELDLANARGGMWDRRLRSRTQPDLIQRRCYGAFPTSTASPDTSSVIGEPKTLERTRRAIGCSLSAGTSLPIFWACNWLATAGRDLRNPRPYRCVINNISGLKTAVENGAGIAVLPDYVTDQNNQLVQILRDIEMPALESYLVYAEEMRSVARVQVFRDFLVSKAQRWTY